MVNRGNNLMSTNIFPPQTRAIDPYSSFDSNVQNRLTRCITQGQNCIYSPGSLDVISGPSDHEVIVTIGQIFIDDVIISIDSNFTVDMADRAFYVSDEGHWWDVAGNYWIIASYQYVKSRPAPQMAIQILKPSQHSLLTSQ